MSDKQPILNSPAIVVVLLISLIVVHLISNVIGSDLERELLLWLAFIPARYGPQGGDIPGTPWAEIISPVTHMFLHGDMAHLLVNGAWLLAVGTVGARRLGTIRFALLFLLSGLAGAFTYLLFNPGAVVVLIGASGAISGVMGAVLRLMFSAQTAEERWLLTREPRLVPRLGVLDVLQDRRALAVLAFWMAINFVFAVGWSDVLTDGKIAWEAHLGGFFFGFLLFGLFDGGRVAGAASSPPPAT